VEEILVLASSTYPGEIRTGEDISMPLMLKTSTSFSADLDSFQILVTGLKVPTPGVKQDKLVMAAE